MKILIVEDHILLREGLVSLLKPQPNFEIVGEAGSVAEAIRLCRLHKPDLVLMDYGLPDGTGLEATRLILAENPQINIVFLTVHEADDELFAAIRSGAKGYLLKNIPVAKMIEAIRGMARGEAPISREMAGRVLAEFARERPPAGGQPQAETPLTARELEVLAEVVRGLSNAEISRRLFISVNTVKNHIHSMLHKLGLKNRHELANYGRGQGIDFTSRK